MLKLQDIMSKIFEKLGCHGNYVILGHFNGYHEMKHNSASAHQNQLEFWNQNSRGRGFNAKVALLM